MKPVASHPFRQSVVGSREKPAFFTAEAEQGRTEQQRRKTRAVFRVFRLSDDETLGYAGTAKKARELCAAIGDGAGWE